MFDRVLDAPMDMARSYEKLFNRFWSTLWKYISPEKKLGLKTFHTLMQCFQVSFINTG